MESFCGDRASQLRRMVYVDASFADCIRSGKSTSGAYLALAGHNTFMPLASLCKKQTCVSHSSTELEIIALTLAVRKEALPLLTLWDIVVDVIDGPQTGRDKRSGGEFASSETALDSSPLGHL